MYGGGGYFIFCMVLIWYLLIKVLKNWFEKNKKFILLIMIIFLIGNIKVDVLMYSGIMINLIFILIFVLGDNNDKSVYCIFKWFIEKNINFIIVWKIWCRIWVCWCS